MKVTEKRSRGGVHRFANFMVSYFELFGMLKQMARHNILLNRSIVHAIRLYVSEVP